jgi:hypothetical protein
LSRRCFLPKPDYVRWISAGRRTSRRRLVRSDVVSEFSARQSSTPLLPVFSSRQIASRNSIPRFRSVRCCGRDDRRPPAKTCAGPTPRTAGVPSAAMCLNPRRQSNQRPNSMHSLRIFRVVGRLWQIRTPLSLSPLLRSGRPPSASKGVRRSNSSDDGVPSAAMCLNPRRQSNQRPNSMHSLRIFRVVGRLWQIRTPLSLSPLLRSRRPTCDLIDAKLNLKASLRCHRLCLCLE